MSEFYPGFDDCESASTIDLAVESGITLFDTADMYGPFENERLVGRCLARHRGRVQIATKVGYERLADGSRVGLNGRPAYIRRACDDSLSRLGVDTIDLYYLHRVDPRVAIEETVGAMAELREKGKIRFLGLSEAGVESLERASRVHPISALQTEYSLLSREVEASILPTARRLGIGFVAYAPLGRGLLSGRYLSREDLPDADYRLNSPRFSPVNLPRNVKLLKALNKVASARKATLAQIALAWLLCRTPDVAVLVGTKRRKHLSENLAALRIQLGEEEIARLDTSFPVGAAAGDRYPDMSRVNR